MFAERRLLSISESNISAVSVVPETPAHLLVSGGFVSAATVLVHEVQMTDVNQSPQHQHQPQTVAAQNCTSNDENEWDTLPLDDFDDLMDEMSQRMSQATTAAAREGADITSEAIVEATTAAVVENDGTVHDEHIDENDMSDFSDFDANEICTPRQAASQKTRPHDAEAMSAFFASEARKLEAKELRIQAEQSMINIFDQSQQMSDDDVLAGVSHTQLESMAAGTSMSFAAAVQEEDFFGLPLNVRIIVVC